MARCPVTQRLIITVQPPQPPSPQINFAPVSEISIFQIRWGIRVDCGKGGCFCGFLGRWGDVRGVRRYSSNVMCGFTNLSWCLFPLRKNKISELQRSSSSAAPDGVFSMIFEEITLTNTLKKRDVSKIHTIQWACELRASVHVQRVCAGVWAHEKSLYFDSNFAQQIE